ncbi:hypothetical protein V8C35DRAFT_294973 [Trichoderma chlorosporum]
MTSFKDSKVGKVTIDVATSGIYLLVILYGFFEDQFDKLHDMMNSPKRNDTNDSAPAPEPAPEPAPPTFKEQLDKEAESRAHPEESEEHSVVKTVVDKISHMIPAVAPIIGGSNPDGTVENKEPPAGPPNRPENDVQIEEFVREQHRSNNPEVLSSGRA